MTPGSQGVVYVKGFFCCTNTFPLSQQQRPAFEIVGGPFGLAGVATEVFGHIDAAMPDQMQIDSDIPPGHGEIGVLLIAFAPGIIAHQVFRPMSPDVLCQLHDGVLEQVVIS